MSKSKFSETELVNMDDINVAPGLNPKIDDFFVDLIVKASEGRVPVYYAAIPLSLVIPFDVEYRPDLHPIGKQYIEKLVEDMESEKYHPLRVYPKGKWFICPDDYMELFAAIQGNPPYVPGYILGDFNNEDVKGVRGPLSVTDVRKILGIDQ